MSKTVILGAGPAGLSCAYKLIENGHTNITILERADTIGGLSKSIKYRDYIFDMGPHQVHTKDENIIRFLKKLLKNDFLIKTKKASHWCWGKYHNYPLGIRDIILGLPINISLSCFKDYVKQSFINLFKVKKEHTFESWVISHFGRKMYDIYFGPYTQKVWGKNPSLLHPICAKERIAVQNLLDVLLSALSTKFLKYSNHYHLPHSPYQSTFYYPRYGYGQICDLMADFITSHGGKIFLNSSAKKIVEKNNIFHISTEEGERIQSDFLFSTIPITVLKNNLYHNNKDLPRPPKEDLEFRSLAFLFLELNIDKVTNNHWIYFPDKNCPFQRVAEFNNFSELMCPQGKSSVCLEIPCDYKDSIWNMNDNVFFNFVMKEATKNYLKQEWVENYFVMREQYAYPTYDLTYDKKLEQINNYIKTFSNLYSIGLQGTFKYINIDHVMAMGFEAADRISQQEQGHVCKTSNGLNFSTWLQLAQMP